MSVMPDPETPRHALKCERAFGDWYGTVCECGWESGVNYPTSEDATDALIDHVREA